MNELSVGPSWQPDTNTEYKYASIFGWGGVIFLHNSMLLAFIYASALSVKPSLSVSVHIGFSKFATVLLLKTGNQQTL